MTLSPKAKKAQDTGITKFRRLRHIDRIKITDPDTGNPIEITLFKNIDSNRVVGIDTEYLKTDNLVYCPFERETLYVDDVSNTTYKLEA